MRACQLTITRSVYTLSKSATPVKTRKVYTEVWNRLTLMYGVGVWSRGIPAARLFGQLDQDS
jgi:hypothetical protein